MIDAGRSFSGKERNCVFLNTRDGHFADLSAGSGFDFPDDGRAIAVTDWDQDGDLDLWISNRNAPRIRLLRNDSTTKNHFLSLRLSGNGTTSNRDAIGARVEVKLKNSTSKLRLVRALRAGEGFLSQSSKWLHFGLGAESEIAEILVRWPDGREESFQGIKADARYHLSQGVAEATPLPRRSGPIALSPSPPAEPSTSGPARIPVVTLLRAPKLNLKDSMGNPAGPAAGRSLLVNLWATWCAPCLVELAEFRDRADDLRAAGVDVLALSVDGLGEAQAKAGNPGKVLSELGFPFPSSQATAPLLAAFQDFHDNLVGLNQPLPVPTSFLIDPQGHLAVIYKGPVTTERLLADLNHSQGTVDERLQRAAQVAGTLIANPIVAKSRRTHEASIQYRYGLARRASKDLEGAAYYLAAARRTDPDFPPAAQELAQLHLSKGEWAKAAAEFESYLMLRSNDASAHHQLAQLHSRLRQTQKARTHFHEVLRLKPDHALAHFGFAALLASQGEPKEAVLHYRAGLSTQPENALASNNLAWLLATHPSPDIRQSGEALRLAIALNEATGNKIPNILDTLAAAQAGLGQFEAAATSARRALSLAEKAGSQQLVTGLKTRLALYDKRKAFLEPKSAKTP